MIVNDALDQESANHSHGVPGNLGWLMVRNHVVSIQCFLLEFLLEKIPCNSARLGDFGQTDYQLHLVIIAIHHGYSSLSLRRP